MTTAAAEEEEMEEATAASIVVAVVTSEAEANAVNADDVDNVDVPLAYFFQSSFWDKLPPPE